MRRVVAAGAALLVLATAFGVAHAKTIPASNGHRWCAERADASVESPLSELSLVVGLGLDLEADRPNAFVCWSNSANAEVVRAWARPDHVVAGVECVPMRGSRTEVWCPRTLVDTPVDDDRRKAVEQDHGAADAGADTTSRGVDVDVSLRGVCAEAAGRSRCTGELRASLEADHAAHVATGDADCKVEPGRRCIVGGGSEPGADADPVVDSHAELDESGDHQTLEIPESE